MTTLTASSVRKGRKQGWPALLHRVAKTIRSKQLLEQGQHVLVAVSGGPDSVALLSLLHRLRSSWQLSLTAVHFNYGLRGVESDEDQAFVTTLCGRLDVPLYTRRLEVRDRSRGTSLQAAARDLRYRALMEVAEECKADRIAVGHTADDQAETVLLWMLRGAGLRGLSGMPVIRNGKIIRPLYESTREDVLAYLGQSGLSFRQDSSNAKLLYTRNRIRHEVLPTLKRLVPSSVKALCRLADLCREDDRYLDAHVAALSRTHFRQAPQGGWAVERAFVQELPVALQRRLVRDMLRRCDPLHRAASAVTVDRVLQHMEKPGNAGSLISDRIRLTVTGDFVQIGPLDRPPVSSPMPDQIPSQVLAIPSYVGWAGTGQTIQVQRLARKQVGQTAPGRTRIIVDADRVSEPLIIRTWQRGDRFHPFGMKGRSKKLQDYFTDLKVPIATRNKIPVVAAPEGIVWIVGYRQDERWAVTPETRRCLMLTAREESNQEGAS